VSTLRINNKFDSKCYFLTMTIVDWINIFTSKIYFDVIIESLKFYQRKDSLKLFAYVIMKNHLHMIVQCKNMIKFVQGFKSYTTKKLFTLLLKNNANCFERIKEYNIRVRKNNQIWLPRNYPKICENEYFFNQKLNYIHDNPVVKGYVERPEEWVYSSARNYYNDDNSIIKVNTECDLD